MTKQELLDKRASIIKEQRDTVNAALKAERKMSVDEQKKFDDLEKDLRETQEEIKLHEYAAKLDSMEKDLSNERDGSYAPSRQDGKNGKELHYSQTPEYKDAFFNGYARKGKNDSLSREHLNALETGADSEGGYLVPEEFSTNIIKIQKELDPVRNKATVITTASDRNIPIEASTGSFGYIDEEAAYPESDPSFGRVVLSAFKSGGIIKASEEFLQDSFFNIPTYLGGLAGRRYNELEEISFANGDGSAKPLGLFQTTSVGGISVTGFQGGVSAQPVFASDDILRTYHSLPRSYRNRATWLMHDDAVMAIRLLKDSEGQYIWRAGLSDGQPDRLLGREVIISDGAPTPAVGSKSLILGDLAQYYIVERLRMVMQRLNELYAATGQVGFRFVKRNDARLVDANAITFFQHGAAS